MPKPTLVIGIDLGGTNMQVGVVDARNKLVGRAGKKTKAREGAAAVIDRIAGAAKAACDDAGILLRDVAAVGIAAPGAMDMPRGVVIDAPNLRWNNFPLRDVLRRKLRRPVVLDNDVNGAVWGEYCLGAAKPATLRAEARARSHDVLGIWVGTGVGGGLVLGGRLFHGTHYTAGEVGLCTLFPGGRKGRRTLEDFCSRTGMSRTILERIKRYPRSRLLAETDGTGEVTGSKQLARAFRAHDKLAVEVVNEAAHLLGIAIANHVTMLSVGTVVIGGGVTEALGKPYFASIRRSFREHVFPTRLADVRLVSTRLKDDAGVFGAALLARASLRA